MLNLSTKSIDLVSSSNNKSSQHTYVRILVEEPDLESVKVRILTWKCKNTYLEWWEYWPENARILTWNGENTDVHINKGDNTGFMN